MVFSKKLAGYEKIVNDFDKGIILIKQEGTYNEILKKHGLL